MIHISHSGSFKHTERFLKKAKSEDYYRNLEALAQRGLEALVSATPVGSGKTADSWRYEIVRKRGSLEIVYSNSNIVDGVLIAVIINTGHGTGTGGYVAGRHYIDPAIQPIFDDIAEKVWKEVTD